MVWNVLFKQLLQISLSGMEYWNEILKWYAGVEYWNGIQEWPKQLMLSTKLIITHVTLLTRSQLALVPVQVYFLGVTCMFDKLLEVCFKESATARLEHCDLCSPVPYH